MSRIEVPCTNGNTVTYDAPDRASVVQTPGVGSRISDVYNARLFAIRELRDYTQHLVGGLLNLIDAVGLPEKQFAAVKRLIHRELWDEHYQRALAWAERQEEIEFQAAAAYWRKQPQGHDLQPLPSVPVHPSYWSVMKLADHIPPEQAFNPFPFSSTVLPSPE